MKKVLLVVTIGILFLSMFSVLPCMQTALAQSTSDPVIPIGTMNHLIVESIADPVTVDPAWAYDTASEQLISNVYDPLIRFDREHTNQFIPCLSTVVPSYDNGLIQDIDVPAPHGLFNFKQRVTFPIRTGVYFHNGELLTPADAEYSFERWLVQDRTGGPQWMMFEPVQGIGNYGNFYLTDDDAVQAQIIDSAFESDANNFYMYLAVRYPPIMGILAQSWGSIVCKSFCIAIGDFDGDWTHWTDWYNPASSPLDAAGYVMDGTGPFKKDYWTLGVEWSIIRNPDYWAGWPAYSQGGIYPDATASDYLDRVTSKIVYEWGTRLADFRAGTADMVYVPRQYISQVQGWPGIRGLKDLPSLSADASFFNFAIDSASPYVGTGVLGTGGIPLDFFSDKNIRLAFAYVFNYTKFIQEVWLNEAIQPSSPIIAGITYHNDSIPKYYCDIDKAKYYFQKASDDPSSPAAGVMTKGFYFKMPYNTGNQPRQVTCEMYKTNVALVNPGLFKIDTVGVTWATYLGELNWYPSFRSIMPVFQMGWQADYPDAHDWVYPFMASTGDLSLSQSYSNSTVDALIEEGISTPDGLERKAIYDELQLMYYQDVPSVMLAQPFGRHWERDWVQGWYCNPVRGGSLAATTGDASTSGLDFYQMWEGLNGDINGDGAVNIVDWVLIISVYWYTPSVKLGPYNPKADVGPHPQYVLGKLPPPGYSVGIVDTLDLAVLNAHWGETVEGAHGGVPPAPGPPGTLMVSSVEDPNLGPGSTFSIDIWLANVQRLVAFEFYLYYDANVLTATGSEGYSPFTYTFTPQIDNLIGSIHVATSCLPPEPTGFDFGEEPYPIMRIDFTVNAYGASMFDIWDPAFVNSAGQEVAVTTYNGWFRNVAGAPIAWFDPPASAVAGTPVTFTSLSIDPEGGPLTLDWNWGDGTTHGTGVTQTHTWTAAGTYTVTLTATNTAGISDTQVRSIVITEPPLAGAIATKGKATHKLLDFTKHGDSKQELYAWAKNLDKTRQTFVKVEMDIWSNIGGYLGTLTTEPMWIAPLAQGQFKSEFDMMNLTWGFVGGGSTTVEYTVYVEVYYADYFIGGDPNNPHWAQVPNPPEVAFTFTCTESAPKPVMAYTYDPSTGTVLFDGSKCTDPDTKHGDYIAEYRWQIYENGVGPVGQVYGPNPSFTLPEDGEYQFRLRVEDMFGVRVQTPWTAYVYFDVP